MKKFIKALFISMLIPVMLTACGGGNDTAENDVEVQEETAVEETAAESSESAEFPMTVTDRDGTEVTIEKEPETLTVFDYAVLDDLDIMGLNDLKLSIPQLNVDFFDGKFSNVTEAGSIKEPNFEAINESNPDLAFIAERQQSIKGEFEEIVPTLYMGTDYENYFETAKENALAVSKIFGKEDIMQKKVDELDSKVSEFRDKTENDERKVLMLMVNDGKISAYGAGSRFGWIHTDLGLKQADEQIEVSTHGMEVNYEYIAKINPDIIFYLDRSKTIGKGDSTDILSTNELVQKTSAGQNNAVFEVPGPEMYLLGGSLNAIENVVNDFNEKLFN